MLSIAAIRYIAQGSAGLITKLILLRQKAFRKVGIVMTEFANILNKNMVIFV